MTIGNETKRNVGLASYCEPAFTEVVPCVCVSSGANYAQKSAYYAMYLLCSTFVRIMLFFNYAHQNIHNNSNFAMISVIQLVIINIINFILLIFLNLMIKF